MTEEFTSNPTWGDKATMTAVKNRIAELQRIINPPDEELSILQSYISILGDCQMIMNYFLGKGLTQIGDQAHALGLYDKFNIVSDGQVVGTQSITLQNAQFNQRHYQTIQTVLESDHPDIVIGDTNTHMNDNLSNLRITRDLFTSLSEKSLRSILFQESANDSALITTPTSQELSRMLCAVDLVYDLLGNFRIVGLGVNVNGNIQRINFYPTQVTESENIYENDVLNLPGIPPTKFMYVYPRGLNPSTTEIWSNVARSFTTQAQLIISTVEENLEK